VPTNLPPAYHEAEREYRAAREPQARLEALERMLRLMPHHKGTDHLRAELRARIARTTQEIERQHAAGGRAHMYTVHREGAGQAVLVGLPNTGKSALLGALTGAPVKIADYPFTTQLPQPAMMPFEDIQVQIVDGPPVTPGATPGWFRGLLHQADLLLLATDLSADPLSEFSVLLEELRAFGIKPVAPGADVSEDDVPVSRKALVVATKRDVPGALEIAELLALEFGDRLPMVAVSAETGEGLDDLRRQIVGAVEIVRVYAKPPGRPPDLERPFVLPRGATVEDLADKIHHDLHDRFRYAVLWHPDRTTLRVARQYVLQDRDVIELHAG
jgi:ribosome-interacting GTPase 1